MLTFTGPTPATLATAFSTMVGNSAAAGQFGGGQGHFHIDGAIILDVDLVDQAELIDVRRDFRVIDRLQRGHDVAAQALGLLGRQCRLGLDLAGAAAGGGAVSATCWASLMRTYPVP